MTIQMKATEQYFPVVLFIMLYKVVLTFESVDEILKCDHSDEIVSKKIKIQEKSQMSRCKILKNKLYQQKNC